MTDTNNDSESPEINNVKQDIVEVEIVPKKSFGKKPQKKKSKIGSGSGGPRDRVSSELLGHIIGAYLSGMYKTQSEIAEALGVSNTLVSNTITKIPSEYLPVRDENKNNKIADGILDLIEEGLAGMKNISRQTQNETWMMNQSADELSTLYDTQGRTVIKIMELMERSDAAKREEYANINPEKVVNLLNDANIKQTDNDTQNIREHIQDSI